MYTTRIAIISQNVICVEILEKSISMKLTQARDGTHRGERRAQMCRREKTIPGRSSSDLENIGRKI